MSTFRVLPTGDILRGCKSIGVYFSADWCPSCTTFAPILNEYCKARKMATQFDGAVAPFQVVLVLHCKTKRNTHNFFGHMPWTALPHIESMGERGQSLMTRFGITTIPDLVLLDSNGEMVCLHGCNKITATQTRATVAPIVTRSSGIIRPAPDLPPDPRLGPGGRRCLRAPHPHLCRAPVDVGGEHVPRYLASYSYTKLIAYQGARAPLPGTPRRCHTGRGWRLSTPAAKETG
jgi:hypothetical protein